MTLAEKLKELRLIEGKARGLNRALTQSEVARLITAETGRSLTQAYLSQLESGKRRHLTANTRELLAEFFKVHPGYLVDDPPAKRRRTAAHPFNQWLRSGHEQLRRTDPALANLLHEIAGEKNARRYFELIAALRRQRDRLKTLLKELSISTG